MGVYNSDMLGERYLSPIEREISFKKWCVSNGGRRVLLDWDETVSPIGAVFAKHIIRCGEYLHEARPALTKEEWRKEIEEGNNRWFEKCGVNPRKWYLIMRELETRHRLEREVTRQAAGILMDIYQEKVGFLDGAEEGMGEMKRSGTELGIVTHAAKKWTWMKYNWLRLDRFIGWDDIFIVNPNGHKTAESWEDACRYFGVKPKNVAMAGDSPRSDINPALEIGVPPSQCFLIETDKRWTIHNQEVNPEVRRVKNLLEVVGVGAEILNDFHPRFTRAALANND